ncbi:phage tail protein [Vibrio splendidus]
MSDFTAIGQLVTEARNLLDSIKGGAIRAMETAFASLIANVNSEWAAKKSQVDNEALAAIGRVDNDTIRGEMGFIALNYNNDYQDTKQVTGADGFSSEYPIGVAFGGDITEYFHTEMLDVKSGDDPATRPEDVKELLDIMGLGRNTSHLAYGGFKVMKMTVIKLSVDGSPFMHMTQDFHQATRNGLTMMHYERTPATSGMWDRKITVFKNGGGNTSEYIHFDARPLGSEVAVGDVLYYALPTMVAGEFPVSEMHSTLPNLRNKQVRDDKVIIENIPNN